MPSISLPTALAVAAVAASAAGTAVTVMGQEAAGKAASAQANYQAAVANNNSILAQRAADDAIARGKVAQGTAATQGKQFLAQQRVALAANGTDIDSGSALDLQSDTAGNNTLDQLTINSNAQRQALGFESQGMNYQAEANLDVFAGTNAKAAADTNALGAGLSGAGSVASKWYDFNTLSGSTAYPNVPNHGA